VTPEGTVYVAYAFAATRQPRFTCNYIDIVPAAKNYDSMRMFALPRPQERHGLKRSIGIEFHTTLLGEFE